MESSELFMSKRAAKKTPLRVLSKKAKKTRSRGTKTSPKPSKKSLSRFWLSQLLIGGLLLIAGGTALIVLIIRSEAVSQTAAPSALYPSNYKPVIVQPSAIYGKPVRLDLPSLGLSLQVIDGYFNSQTKTWTLTTNKVQYATITPEPNNAAGNTFIYGHYRRNVFANLYKIAVGDVAVIRTSNDHLFTYRFRSSRITSPNDVALFSYQGPPILTLQTCTGLFYQNRQLFTFDLIGAK